MKVNFFFSCRILRWLRDEEDQLKENNLPKIEHLIVEMSRKNSTIQSFSIHSNNQFLSVKNCYCSISAAVIDIDTSGIHALEELYKSLAKHDIKVIETQS